MTHGYTTSETRSIFAARRETGKGGKEKGKGREGQGGRGRGGEVDSDARLEQGRQLVKAGVEG